jgi:hypothetical protein
MVPVLKSMFDLTVLAKIVMASAAKPSGLLRRFAPRNDVTAQ